VNRRFWFVFMSWDPDLPHQTHPQSPIHTSLARFSTRRWRLCFYVLGAFLPSVPGRARDAHLRIKTPPDDDCPTATCCHMHDARVGRVRLVTCPMEGVTGTMAGLGRVGAGQTLPAHGELYGHAARYIFFRIV
jgi:hypothetical protein